MADITFSCPSCNQLLTADDSLVGREIGCPSCNETIIVQDQSGMAGGSGGGLRLSVPTGGGDPNAIQKPAKPLDAAAKAAFSIRCKTIRHHECVNNGVDKFDETVGSFLGSIGEDNRLSMESIQYSRIEKEVPMIDYGVMIIYKAI